MHRRGYEGTSTLWKNHGKLKSFQRFGLPCNQAICRKASLLGKKAGSERHRPFFEKGIVPAAQPSSKVIIMARPRRDKDGMGPNASPRRGSEPITSGF